MESHIIIYEGLELEVFGEFDESDETTGYVGGWSTFLIKVNDVDISWMLNENTIDNICQIILEIKL